LIGGSSTLVVRDVYADKLPWLNVTLGFLADHLRWHGQVRGTAVLGCVATVPADVAAYDPFTEASLDECLRYHDALANPAVGPQWRFLAALSRGRLIAAKGAADEAVGYLRGVEEEHAELLADEKNQHLSRLRRLEEIIRKR